MSLHPHAPRQIRGGEEEGHPFNPPFKGEELYDQVTRLTIIVKRCYPMKTRISLTKSVPGFCLTGLMAVLPSWVEANFMAYAADTSSFGGLGKGGLITVIVVAVLLISAFVWILHGTKRRD
jgi:hypothetical protein